MTAPEQACLRWSTRQTPDLEGAIGNGARALLLAAVARCGGEASLWYWLPTRIAFGLAYFVFLYGVHRRGEEYSVYRLYLPSWQRNLSALFFGREAMLATCYHDVDHRHPQVSAYQLPEVALREPDNLSRASLPVLADASKHGRLCYPLGVKARRHRFPATQHNLKAIPSQESPMAMRKQRSRLSILLLVAACCLPGGIPAAWAQVDARVSSPADQGPELSAEKLALGYMSASFILEIAIGVAKLPNLTLQTSIDGQARSIDQANAAEFVVEYKAKVQGLHEAIQRKGFRDITGRYHVQATPSCERSGSLWAGGIYTGDLGEVRVLQDGYKVRLQQAFKHQGKSHAVETPGIVVQDALVFSDLANSDFTFVARIADGEITARPNVEAILATWPGFVKAPSKEDLAGCVVTLQRVGE